MKHLLLLFLLIFSFKSFAQVSVEGVNINEIDSLTFIELVGANKGVLSQKIIISIGYGQKYEFMQTQLIKDANGKPVIFNSMIDALNFMSNNGWDYINNYVITYSSGSVYHYLLKKKD